MDVTTFANVRLNEDRVADQARELRLLASHAERHAALGSAERPVSHRSVGRFLWIRRGTAAPQEQAPYALAGPSS